MNARRRQRRRRRFLPYVYKHSRCDSIPIVRFDRFTPAFFLARPRALPPSRETKREDKLVSFTRARPKRYIGGISWFVNRQNDTIGFRAATPDASETPRRTSETPRLREEAPTPTPTFRSDDVDRCDARARAGRRIMRILHRASIVGRWRRDDDDTDDCASLSRCGSVGRIRVRDADERGVTAEDGDARTRRGWVRWMARVLGVGWSRERKTRGGVRDG